jgi:23S rRNA (uracil1939-C5)-methyltransferase
VRGSGPVGGSISTLSTIAQKHRLARLTRHGELVLLRHPPDITIGTAQVTLPPGSFPSRRQSRARMRSPRSWSSTASVQSMSGRSLLRRRADSPLRLAAKSRVTAFDNDAGAVAALQKAVTSTSGLKPVKRRRATCSAVR